MKWVCVCVCKDKIHDWDISHSSILCSWVFSPNKLSCMIQTQACCCLPAEQTWYRKTSCSQREHAGGSRLCCSFVSIRVCQNFPGYLTHCRIIFFVFQKKFPWTPRTRWLSAARQRTSQSINAISPGWVWTQHCMISSQTRYRSNLVVDVICL